MLLGPHAFLQASTIAHYIENKIHLIFKRFDGYLKEPNVKATRKKYVVWFHLI